MSAMNRQASQAIREQQDALVQAVSAHVSGRPLELETLRPPGEHLAFLAEAVALDDPRLFDDHVRWLQSFLNAAEPNAIPEMLERLQSAIGQVLPASLAAAVTPFVSSGLAVARHVVPPGTSLLAGNSPLDHLARSYLDTLLNGERQHAERLIMTALGRWRLRPGRPQFGGIPAHPIRNRPAVAVGAS